MPAQEVFIDSVIDGNRVQVGKTYDQGYVPEAFGMMADSAKAFLWSSIKPEEIYEASELPIEPDIEHDAFLLDEMLDQGREEWNLFSYFAVLSESDGRQEPVLVSADWPTAETFAKSSPFPPGDTLHPKFPRHPAPAI